jgi:nucleoside-diphosphate-sugar epimerase
MSKLILGCGYLGRVLARQWLAAGQTVYGTTRSPARAAELDRLGVRPVLWDVTRPETDAHLPAARTVVWCVAPGRGDDDPSAVAVAGLDRLLEHWAPAAGPAVWLHVGSTSVYGQTDGSWVDEGDRAEPLTAAGRRALEAEQVLVAAARGRLAGLRWVTLRFAGLYGPGRIIGEKAMRAGEPLIGNPETWLNLVHVEDGAAAVRAADRLDDASPVVNVCDDEPLRRRDYYQLAANTLGLPPPRFAAPAGGPEPDRRVRNSLLKEGLGVTLNFPSVRQGLPAAISAAGPDGTNS